VTVTYRGSDIFGDQNEVFELDFAKYRARSIQIIGRKKRAGPWTKWDKATTEAFKKNILSSGFTKIRNFAEKSLDKN